MKGHLLSIIDTFKGRQVSTKNSVFTILFWLSEVKENRNVKRDTVVLRAIRFKPMQELKMDDFLGG